MKDSLRWLFFLGLISIVPVASVAQDYDSAGKTGSTLEDFFSAAVEFSPTLQIAEEGLNIGSARRRAANGRLLPQVSARASISDNRNESQGRPNKRSEENASLFS